MTDQTVKWEDLAEETRESWRCGARAVQVFLSTNPVDRPLTYVFYDAYWAKESSTGTNHPVWGHLDTEQEMWFGAAAQAVANETPSMSGPTPEYLDHLGRIAWDAYNADVLGSGA